MISECQLDLVDMQQVPDNTYKFILIYQDYATQCCLLRPMASMHALEVALTLTIDIFKTLGVPSILKCTSDEVFAYQLRRLLSQFGMHVVVVHDNVQPQNRENHMNCNVAIVHRMINCWLTTNTTGGWAYDGLEFIQFQTNLSIYYKVINLPNYINRGHHLKYAQHWATQFKRNKPAESTRDVNIQARAASCSCGANVPNGTDLSPTIGAEENDLILEIVNELLGESRQQNPTFSPVEIDEI